MTGQRPPSGWLLGVKRLNAKKCMLAVMENETPQRRGPGRPPNPAGRKYPKGHPRYTPTKVDLEEDMRVDCSFDELIDAMFGRRPRRVLH